MRKDSNIVLALLNDFNSQLLLICSKDYFKELVEGSLKREIAFGDPQGEGCK